MSTNAIAVKVALKALIDGLPGLTDTQRTYGTPSNFEKLWVSVGKVQWARSEWETNRSREETFTIDVCVSVVHSAGDAESVETQAVALAAHIEDAVKANPQIDNPKVVTSGFKPQRLTSYPNDVGAYEAQYDCVLDVTARL